MCPISNQLIEMNKSLFSLLTALSVTYSCQSQDAEIINVDAQIMAALNAAPEDMAPGATVMGYDSENQVVVIREGSNNLVCQADDPQREGFNVACYHKDVEPFMTRGRELRAEGLSRTEVFATRGEEIAAGTLQGPPKGSTLNIYYGPDEIHNKETGEVDGGQLRWVIYMPFETGESTGLPEKPPFPGAPWLMEPGTHRAHIMITPPAKEED